jgi:peptidoglycan/xylan/chitin deacetylase (PgdA/CDA1 family)
MSAPCPELLRFWGLTSADIASGRIQVAATVRAEGRVVELELDDELRPEWIDRGTRVPIWIDRRIEEQRRDRRSIACFIDGTRRLPAITLADDGVRFHFDPQETISSILQERYLKPRRPIHSFFPLPYHWAPGRLRLLLFRWMTRRLASGEVAGGAPFPAWPIDASVEALRHVFIRCVSLAAGRQWEPALWPHEKRWAFAVSHDVDTRRGFARIMEVARLEAGYGVKSCWYVVGNAYPLDLAVLDELHRQGNEIGLHGDRHDNRIAYLEPKVIARRLGACAGLVERYRMVGFRSPSLLETEALRATLRRSFQYASQTPDTEVDSLIAPRRGCSTCFPFVKQGLLEIPITLPLEDKLLMADYDEERILALWRKKVSWIRRVGGLAHLVLHNEPHLLRRSLKAYEAILRDVAQDESVWRATPGEIAHIWRETRLDES